VVFDLPQVVVVTEKIIQESGLEERITCAGGDLRTDLWPGGADLILLSYIVSCYEHQTLRDLLARCLAYLPSGGGLLIHDFALYADRSGPHNTALFLFGELTVSAQAQSYTVEELGAAMQEAGFAEVVMQPFLPDLSFQFTRERRHSEQHCHITKTSRVITRHLCILIRFPSFLVSPKPYIAGHQ